MKVAIYNGLGGISVEEKAVPEIRETDVLVRNLRAGICGTDINIVKAGSEMGIRYGAEFGHEMVSKVVEVGKMVSPDIKVGMIVGVNPITAKRAGRSYSLECGGFSQYIVVEDAKLDYNLYEMNPDVPLETMALMEPMSVGRHGAFRTNPKPTDKIVVLGAGPIGLSAAASLIAEGMKNVCVVDMDQWRLEKAKEIGAQSLNTSTQSLSEGLAAIFGETDSYGHKVPDVDIYIDAAGAPALFIEIMKWVKHGARISLIAVYKTQVPLNLSQVMSKEVVILGSSGYTHEDIKAVVGYINNNETKIGNTVSKVYRLDNIQEAFQVAIEAKKVIKVIIDME
ncbi:zinc-binding dehydrogenase [Sphingobacterium siyangense subsp. cladoniae]|uniref:zinc-dependent alcohol dehydrogenase n=1 Tax=Sphingobacterium siyangense TaxID=459529 RepID=UPI0031FA3B86